VKNVKGEGNEEDVPGSAKPWSFPKETPKAQGKALGQTLGTLGPQASGQIFGHSGQLVDLERGETR